MNLKETFNSSSDYCKNESIIKAVKENFEKQENDANLPENQRIKKFILVSDEWTPENNLLTAAFKLRRKEIFKKYEKIFEEMYQN
jgi:long-chain acyl-CoA synthetase